MESDTITFISDKQHLRSEGRADELSTHASGTIFGILAALLRRDFIEHLCNCGTVLGVEIGVDFIEEVKGGWVALLDCEHERERT